jgi:RoxA-like, cytochrome c-like
MGPRSGRPGASQRERGRGRVCQDGPDVEDTADGLFDSTVDLRGQLLSEDLLRRLAPPKWPEEVLGKIDREKAAQGKQLFATNCSGCHSTWPHRWSEPKKEGKRFIENAIVPIGLIGTDAATLGSWRFVELTRPTSMAGPLSDHLAPPFTGLPVVPAPALLGTVIQGVFDKAMAKLNLSEEERVAAHGYQAFYPEPQERPPSLSSYKANPAEGMWASPPFLHNGSVPNLYELLSPAKERSKTFFIGRDFDPVKVGVDTSGASGKFLFDTSLFGNSNIGHSFENGSGPGVLGPLLTEEERWALVEYMKSIPDKPGQIAPFGGPEHPVRAWKDKTFFNVRNPGTYNGAPE